MNNQRSHCEPSSWKAFIQTAAGFLIAAGMLIAVMSLLVVVVTLIEAEKIQPLREALREQHDLDMLYTPWQVPTQQERREIAPPDPSWPMQEYSQEMQHTGRSRTR